MELTHAASLDIQEAWFWYEDKKIGLGEDFLLSLEATLNQLQRDPLLYKVAYLDVRIALLKRFPYKVVYILRNNLIGIVGVVHHKRDPIMWQERIE